MISCTFENGNKASLRHAIVDAIVVKDGKILLVKRSGKILEGGKWALVGGFIDRDENLEQALKREVLEETGWSVKTPNLFRIISKPDRPNEDRQNIAFIYICEADQLVGKPDWESDEQKWFKLNNLPEVFAFDHLENIELYKKYLEKDFALPVLD